MSLLISILWIIAAGTTAKLDAVMSEQKTSFISIIISCFCWPIVALCLLNTKHKISNSNGEFGF